MPIDTYRHSSMHYYDTQMLIHRHTHTLWICIHTWIQTQTDAHKDTHRQLKTLIDIPWHTDAHSQTHAHTLNMMDITDRHTQRHSQTNRQTDRHAHTNTHRTISQSHLWSESAQSCICETLTPNGGEKARDQSRAVYNTFRRIVRHKVPLVATNAQNDVYCMYTS